MKINRVCEMIPGHLYKLSIGHQHYHKHPRDVFLCTKEMVAGYQSTSNKGHCLINIETGGLWVAGLLRHCDHGYIDVTKELMDE